MHQKYKKIIQSISYLPNFISWVILSGIFITLFSPSRGIINYFINLIGLKPIYFLSSSVWFVPILIITGIWQSIGWNSIIYLASISGIDQEQYEAAEIEGANRLQQAFYITLPSLLPVITVLFMLGLGNILNAGFDQIFNMYNPSVLDVSEIIDTYVYSEGLLHANYSFSTAVGLFKNIIGFFLIVAVNFIIKKFTDNEYSLW
jgi:putative aldouronate transport system permease protein